MVDAIASVWPHSRAVMPRILGGNGHFCCGSEAASEDCDSRAKKFGHRLAERPGNNKEDRFRRPARLQPGEDAWLPVAD